MKKINILIADDHWMVREGLKQLLSLNSDFNIIGEACDGVECLDLINRLEPDILLLDINMPQINGLQVLTEIKSMNCTLKILVVTIHNEPEYLKKALQYGANGYVLKDSSFEILEKAIVTVYSDDMFIDPELTPYLYSDTVIAYESTTLDSLTDREREVLIQLTKGLFNKEIGYHLGISEKTVKNHVSNIFKKIDVSDRTQAAIYAIRNNLVEL